MGRRASISCARISCARITILSNFWWNRLRWPRWPKTQGKRSKRMHKLNRRQFIRDLGISAAALPLVMGLPSLGLANPAGRKQRLVICFSPNGIVPDNFWPDEQGECFMLKRILAPLEHYQNKLLSLRGVANRV